jgi:hopene-associated glycosyltransferase HpnB
VFTALAAISLAIWIYLALARGAFWHLHPFDDDITSPKALASWPRVVAVVPARNEAATIAQSVGSLLAQDYSGELSIVLVDDHSDDGTSEIARDVAGRARGEARASIHSASPLPPGWTGKLWALKEGVARAAANEPAYYWFTDADIVHAPDTLRRLMTRAEKDLLDLTSLMVLLRAETFAERMLVPAFLFFFLKLYPPRWIADPRNKTAGAAGGCVLLRREALERIGGLASIRHEIIDDCALARAVKRSGGGIWMGLTRTSVSLRAYKSFGEIRDMIARTAFTQLRYSVLLLIGTLFGMLLTYIAPVGLIFVHRALPRILAVGACLLMSLLFLPTVRFYRLSPFWSPALPFTALFYCYATCLSAIRCWLGRGAQWKGRTQAPQS